MDNIKNLRVLYVEDDEDIRDAMVSLLKPFVKDIFVGVDGVDGVDKYLKFKPDVILSDVNMPHMDGLEMYAKIKEFDSNVKIIIMSAHNDVEFFTRSIALGVSDYVLKPVDITRLIDKLKEIADAIDVKKKYQSTLRLLDEYKLAVDKSLIVSKTDKHGIITYANDKFCQLSGYSKDELLGSSHNIVRHPDEPKELFKQMWKTISIDKKIFKGVIKNRTKDGHTYIVDATIVPILDSKDNIIEFIALRTDITEHLAYKNILEEQFKSNNTGETIYEKIDRIQKYESAFETYIGQTRIDLNGNYIFVSKKCLGACGYEQSQLIGKNITILKHPHQDNDSYKHLLNAIANQISWSGTLKNISKDGKTFYINSNLIPITNLDSKIVEFVLINRDISEVVTLHKEIENTQKEVIFTLGTIGEARSKETGNHVKRVAEYSYLLAKLYGLSSKDCNLIKLASPMHDIGKIGIPDSVLKKPAKLTYEEFEIMKTHSKIGYDMLKSSNQEIMKVSASIALTHHEKYNGKGYPKGLKANDIDIFGRITAIADVFDALGSDRVYKKAWELDKIIKLLKEEKSQHFDPKIVDIFLNNLDKFLLIREKYKDV